MAQEALDSSDAVDEGLCYIASAMFSTLCILIDSSWLYGLKAEKLIDWPKIAKCWW